jgi:riboflavin biosynthesis pyrimidine reductase
MSRRLSWWLAAVVVCGLVAGCENPSAEPNDPLAVQMRQDKTAPTVSGPQGDVAARGEMSKVADAVRKVLRDSKVQIVQTGQPGAGKWYFGQSLAGRKVLVEITPLLPDRSVVRVTVEGGDQLTQELLDHLSQEIARKTR